MSKFKVEKNIPVSKATWGKIYKYPFREMKIGDSFLLPKKEFATYDQVMKVRTNCCAYGRRNKVKFTVRKTEQGYRIWRIK